MPVEGQHCLEVSREEDNTEATDRALEQAVAQLERGQGSRAHLLQKPLGTLGCHAVSASVVTIHANSLGVHL